jgi:hypothetical protein
MRLLNIKTLKLHEFFGGSSLIPHYAILSHRWEKEEVTFQDFEAGRGKDMYGWAKITGCCEQVAKDGLQFVVSVSIYILADEICIRKSDTL